MTERRYTDAEVSEILARATESEQAPLPSSSDGMTLGALQEIGREVGIAPELIAQAARSLEMAGQPELKRFLGFPIEVGRTVEIDRPLSDADWEGLVSDLRDTFEARGTLKHDGSFRQWTNGNLHALVEPTAGGYRVRLRTMDGRARRLMTAGLAMTGIALVMLLVVTLGGNAGGAGSTSALTFMGGIGVGLFAIGAVRLPGWARRRAQQIEAIAARLVGKAPASS